jgi:hypothetical protein
MSDVTQILSRIEAGDPAASEQIAAAGVRRALPPGPLLTSPSPDSKSGSKKGESPLSDLGLLAALASQPFFAAIPSPDKFYDRAHFLS